LSEHGATFACLDAVLGTDVTLIVSPYILAEIRRLPDHKRLRQKRGVTRERIE
jgi:hypothetical protein